MEKFNLTEQNLEESITSSSFINRNTNTNMHRKQRKPVKKRSYEEVSSDSLDGDDTKPRTSLKLENEGSSVFRVSGFEMPSNCTEDTSLINDIKHAASSATAEDEFNKTYVCHLCDFKTAYANSLMNHQVVHSDFRPWICSACEYAAKRKQDLKKHMQTVHGMAVESLMLKPIEISNHLSVPANSMSTSFLESDLSAPQPSTTPIAPTFVTTIKEEKVEAQPLDLHLKHEIDAQNKSSIPGVDYNSRNELSPVSFTNCHKPTTVLVNSDIKQDLPDSAPKLLPNRLGVGQSYNRIDPHLSWQLKEQERILTASSSRSSHRGCDEKSNGHNDKFSLWESREDNSLHHSLSLSDDESSVNDDRHAMLVETDGSISSSSLLVHRRATQTPSGFLCEHCDIMFFQRAMYVMHIGLHAPDNPWRCSVCGNVFSEKYSFTSHFINQH